MGDFEEAIRNACTKVFPRGLYYGDSFHFFKDNRKWMLKNQGYQHLDELIPQLRILWASDSMPTFRINKGIFVKHWINTYSLFANYFTKVWLSRFPTEM